MPHVYMYVRCRLHFVKIPRRVLCNLLEAIGVVAPAPFADEAEYLASTRSDWRRQAHVTHAAVAASPWGPGQIAPPSLAEYLRLREIVAGDELGAQELRRVLLPRMEAWSEDGQGRGRRRSGAWSGMVGWGGKAPGGKKGVSVQGLLRLRLNFPYLHNPPSLCRRRARC